MLFVFLLLFFCKKKEDQIIENIIENPAEYLHEFNEIQKPLEDPNRKIIIGRWIEEGEYEAKEWNFYENGTFESSLIACSIIGNWKYINNRIFITEPLEIVYEYDVHENKLKSFYIDVEIIDNNHMIFSGSKYIDDYFGYTREEDLKLEKC